MIRIHGTAVAIGDEGVLLRGPSGIGKSDLALRLIDEARVGLAPGSAFGSSGRGFLRLCFARNAEQLETAMQRLVSALAARIA